MQCSSNTQPACLHVQKKYLNRQEVSAEVAPVLQMRVRRVEQRGVAPGAAPAPCLCGARYHCKLPSCPAACAKFRPPFLPAHMPTCSQRLARMSADPQIIAAAKATLRREAAEVRRRRAVPAWQAGIQLLPLLQAQTKTGLCGKRVLIHSMRLSSCFLALCVQVHSIPKVSSEELLPTLESVLSLRHQEAEEQEEGEQEALASVGIQPMQPALPSLPEH